MYEAIYNGKIIRGYYFKEIDTKSGNYFIDENNPMENIKYIHILRVEEINQSGFLDTTQYVSMVDYEIDVNTLKYIG